MKKNQITRRLRGILLLLLCASVTSLTSCGDAEKKAAKSVTSEKEDKVVLYSWDEYFSEDVLAAFTEKTGIEVVYETFDNTDEMQEKLKSNPGKYDVLVLDDHTVRLLIGQRLLRDLDRNALTNFGNIDSRFLDEDGRFDKGNSYSVPYMTGTTLVAYRSDLIEVEDPSWNLFEKVEPGKVSLLDERLEVYGAAEFAMRDAAQFNSEEDRIAATTDTLVRLVKEKKIKFGTDNEMKEHLISGDSHVAMMYSGDAALIAEENEDLGIEFFIPKEGAMMWIDNFVVARDSSRPGAANKFINYMMEAKVAAESSNYLWYATPNKAARPYLNEELLNDETIFPDESVLAKCSFLEIGNSKRERLINQGWRKVQQAVDSATPKNQDSKFVSKGEVLSTTEED